MQTDGGQLSLRFFSCFTAVVVRLLFAAARCSMLQYLSPMLGKLMRLAVGTTSCTRQSTQAVGERRGGMNARVCRFSGVELTSHRFRDTTCCMPFVVRRVITLTAQCCSPVTWSIHRAHTMVMLLMMTMMMWFYEAIPLELKGWDHLFRPAKESPTAFSPATFWRIDIKFCGDGHTVNKNYYSFYREFSRYLLVCISIHISRMNPLCY